MKKVLSLVMVLTIMLSLVACGENSTIETTKQDGINLTMDNYQKYLDVNITSAANKNLDNALHVGSNPGIPTKDGSYTFYLYNKIYGSASVKGVSTNFNYEDVCIAVKITGQYDAYNNSTFNSKKDYSFDLKVETNIAGKGYDEQELSIAPHYTHSDFMNYDYEIISISGRVVPAN